MLRTTRYVEHDELTDTSEVVDTGVVTVLVGDRSVITVRHGAAGALWRVREDLEKRTALLAAGPWAVVYAISSAMVDVYLDVAAHVERDLERLEETAPVSRATTTCSIRSCRRGWRQTSLPTVDVNPRYG